MVWQLSDPKTPWILACTLAVIYYGLEDFPFTTVLIMGGVGIHLCNDVDAWPGTLFRGLSLIVCLATGSVRMWIFVGALWLFWLVLNDHGKKKVTADERARPKLAHRKARPTVLTPKYTASSFPHSTMVDPTSKDFTDIQQLGVFLHGSPHIVTYMPAPLLQYPRAAVYCITPVGGSTKCVFVFVCVGVYCGHPGMGGLPVNESVLRPVHNLAPPHL